MIHVVVCAACDRELPLDEAIDPARPKERRRIRAFRWSWRRHNFRWVPFCPACTLAVTA